MGTLTVVKGQVAFEKATQIDGSIGISFGIVRDDLETFYPTFFHFSRLFRFIFAWLKIRLFLKHFYFWFYSVFTSLPLGLGEGATRPFIVDLALVIFQSLGFMHSLVQHESLSSVVSLDSETILTRGEELMYYWMEGLIMKVTHLSMSKAGDLTRNHTLGREQTRGLKNMCFDKMH